MEGQGCPNWRLGRERAAVEVAPRRLPQRCSPHLMTVRAGLQPAAPRTREEPCTLTQGGALFSLVPLVVCCRLGIEPKTPGWLVQSPTTSPSGDLERGHCNYVELIDTIFTDVEGVD